MPPTLASAVVLGTIGFFSKAFLRLACRDYRVEGLDILLKALEEGDGAGKVDKGKGKERGEEGERERLIDPALREEIKRRGIVTICNHISVVDDPMMWGMLPLRHFFPFTSLWNASRRIRWTLGASDIMFTKPFHAKFFNNGQVIETVRGGGIFQPAVDEAVKKLQEGEWIHIFPEGRVNQPNLHPEGGLWRFKWGVSRIIMDSETMPIIIPIWITGFNEIMPDSRKTFRWLPLAGKRPTVTVGQPITDKVLPFVEEWKRLAASVPGTLGVGGEWSGSEGGSARESLDGPADAERASTNTERQRRGTGQVGDGEEERIRIKICDVLYEELLGLGLKVEKREGKDKDEWRNTVKMETEIV